MAQQEIRVPDIGDFKEVEVIEILVAAGDSVALEDPLVTLESDKASMDIPAPQAGTIVEVKIAVGDKVSEGDVIALLETSASEEKTESDKKETAPAEKETAKSDNDKSDNDAQTASDATAAAPARPPPPPPAQVDEVAFVKVHASPSVRYFARELGVDLSKVTGTGRKERITKTDVQQFVKQVLSGHSTAAPSAGAGIPPIPEIDFSQFGEIEMQALSRIQKISGPHLHRAWLNVPMVTHHDEADVTELEDFRQALKPDAEKRGVRVTALVFIMKALVASLKAFPSVNASLAADGANLILKKYYHLGIAVDTPNGLVVPVLRDVDQKSIFDLSEELGEVSKRVRDGKLSPKDLQGGCMSISSLGGIGGTAFTPLVNAPEVAILGVTRSQMKPVWNGKDKTFVPRLMLPLDLTYDHRVIDGALAARFMVELCRNLSDIRRLLL